MFLQLIETHFPVFATHWFVEGLLYEVHILLGAPLLAGRILALYSAAVAIPLITGGGGEDIVCPPQSLLVHTTYTQICTQTLVQPTASSH